MREGKETLKPLSTDRNSILAARTCHRTLKGYDDSPPKARRISSATYVQGHEDNGQQLNRCSS